MRRIKLTVAYDGTNYSGWQIQPNHLTIEQCLNEAITALCGEETAVIGASRTDAGVHACGNVAVFDTNMQMPGEKFAYAINQRLPLDIRVMKSEECAPIWHPRKAVSSKVYEYKIYNERIANPMQRLYAHHCYYPLSLGDMRAAAEYLIGEHDFTSFTNPDSQVLREGGSAVREIYDITILVEHGRRYQKSGETIKLTAEAGSGAEGAAAAAAGSGADVSGTAGGISGGFLQQEPEHQRGYYGMITLKISGSGFLYNMVRIIAGTLLRVGTGLYEPSHVKEILEARNRQLAGPTAEAKGLTLLKLDYKE